MPVRIRAALLSLCFWACSGTAANAVLEAQFRTQADATLGGLVRGQRSSYAAAVLVEGGKETAALAYGVEDPASRTPFSIESTSIDINSLRKLFVAIAIAQLIDRGLIASIDDPVNKYLKHYSLPAAFGHDVTIRELATHSAGLDETQFGGGLLEADPPRFFRKRFPGYFENPGRFSAYDSYGPKLLAYLVSEMTGKPFSDYVVEAILEPLNMRDTHLVSDRAPIERRAQSFQPKVPSHVQALEMLQPTNMALLNGETTATLRDMAKLMIALLSSDGQRVISPRMRQLLFTLQQSNGPGGSAHGFVFDAVRVRGNQLFVHGGIGTGILCWLAIDPGRSAGIFYCYSYVKWRLDRDPTLYPPAFPVINDAMLRPFTTCPDSAGPDCGRYPPARWNPAWQAYLGLYQDFQRHRRGFSRLRSIAHPVFARVSRAGDSMALDGVGGFVEIAPATFGNAQHLETFSFVPDPATGKLVLSISDRASAFSRVDWSNDPRIVTRLLALLLVLAMSGGLIIIWPRYGIDLKARAATLSYALVTGIGVVALYGCSAFGDRYFHGISWPLHVLRVCAFLTIPACAFLLVTARRLARMPLTGAARVGRLHLDIICMSAVVLVVTLLAIELISFTPIR